jgi:hypothetical protein
VDEHGNKVDDVDQIKKVAVDFYKNLLGTDQLQFTEAKVARIKQLILVAISSEHAAILEKEVSAKEIKDTLFHMKANMAPNSDGFFANFLRLLGLLWVRRLWMLLKVSLIMVHC